jgi:hypothetical protein
MSLSSRLCALAVTWAFCAGTAGAEETPAPATTPSATPISATAAEREDIPRPSFKLAVGLGAGAAAALVTGIILGAVAKTRSDEQNGDVGSPPLYTPDLQSRGNQGDRMATAAYVLFGVGGALAIADIVLWVERLRPRKHAAPQATQATRATIAPMPTGLSVRF